jgi:hypothetical protein
MLSQNRAERLEVDLLDAANPSFFHPLPSCPNPKPCGPFVSEFLFEDSQNQMSSNFFPHFIDLSLSAPDALEEAVALGQSVEGVVALAHGSDETAEGVDVVLALDGTTVLVNLGNGDLDRAVILGLDDAVGGAALAGDVKVHNLAAVVLHFG